MEEIQNQVLEEQPRGLIQRLGDMEKTLNELAFVKDKKKKKFELPFSIRRGSKQKLQQGYCLTFLIRLNGELTIHFYPIEHNCVRIPFNNTYHVVTPNEIIRWKKYPVIILPEWSMRPLDPGEHFRQAKENNELSITEKVLMDLMKQFQAGTLKSKLMGGKMILFVMIAVAAGLYFLSQIITGGGG